MALDTEDETFARLNAWAPADVDVLVAGHSLAPRSHPRYGSARYLNTGCWAPVLWLSPETLQNSIAFASVFDALTGRDSLQKIWTKRATVASVVQAGPVKAGLRSVELDGSLLRVVDAVLPEVPNPSRANANLDVPIPAFQEVHVDFWICL